MITKYDTHSGTFLRTFNLRYRLKDKTFETRIIATSFTNAEEILDSIKNNSIIHSELIEVQDE